MKQNIFKILLIGIIGLLLMSLNFRNNNINKPTYFVDPTLHFKYMATELEDKSKASLNKTISVIDTIPSFFKKYELVINSIVCKAEHKKDSMLFFKRSKVVYDILIKKFKKHSKRLKIISVPKLIEKEEYCERNTGVVIVMQYNYSNE